MQPARCPVIRSETSLRALDAPPLLLRKRRFPNTVQRKKVTTMSILAYRAKWQPMETAPLDGRTIQAEIPGHGSDNLIAFAAVGVDENGDEAFGWQFVSEQEPPESWTYGVCWALNEDNQPSVKPTRWKPFFERKS